MCMYIYTCVCKINCEHIICVDSIKKNDGKILIESMCDKYECYHCGRRNIVSYEYEAIKFIDIDIDIDYIDDKVKCKCGNNIKYKLKNKNKINCQAYGELFYDENEHEHNICSTKCEFKHEWKINEYLSKKKIKT